MIAILAALVAITVQPTTIGIGDSLVLDPIRIIPLPPYTMQRGDVVHLSLAPKRGLYPVATDGTIDLGAGHGGRVRIAGLSTHEVAETVQLRVWELDPDAAFVSAALAESRWQKELIGQHVVRDDGTIHLRWFGAIRVEGLTSEKAKAAIEKHLSVKLYRPEISVELRRK